MNIVYFTLCLIGYALMAAAKQNAISAGQNVLFGSAAYGLAASALVFLMLATGLG